MENWVFDSNSNCYYYYYGSTRIAIIYPREEYFFLELLPPFIHERIVLHYKDKENVFNGNSISGKEQNNETPY